MSGAKLIGCGLVILFGALAGRAKGETGMESLRALEAVSDMLRRMLFLLQYEQPTVDEMLKRVCISRVNPPGYITAGAEGRESLLLYLSQHPDCLPEEDHVRLDLLLRELGSADKITEQQRISAALACFDERIKTLRPAAESSRKLCRSLGLLGGIFIVVMLV